MEHYPVLLAEAIEHLAIDAEGTYVDATLGDAGYSLAIAERLGGGRLIAIDRDAEAIERSRLRLESERDKAPDKVTLVHAAFAEIAEVVGRRAPVEGIVADLGVSRPQLERAERGFSFQREAALDMRMDQRGPLTAADIVNFYDERQIADLIYRYGEERRSRRIARTIVRERPFRTTHQLAEAVERAAPRAYRQRIHPATKTFQALRIAVNDELGQLEKLLEDAPPLLAPGGRLVIVSFHSLEDRLVKLSFRSWKQRGVLELITRRVLRPSEGEVRENPASRSAKMRVAERTSTEWPSAPS